eukprot:1142646-Pelagomonas_calceolata.AAC.10
MSKAHFTSCLEGPNLQAHVHTTTAERCMCHRSICLRRGTHSGSFRRGWTRTCEGHAHSPYHHWQSCLRHRLASLCDRCASKTGHTQRKGSASCDDELIMPVDKQLDAVNACSCKVLMALLRFTALLMQNSTWLVMSLLWPGAELSVAIAPGSHSSPAPDSRHDT